MSFWLAIAGRKMHGLNWEPFVSNERYKNWIQGIINELDAGFNCKLICKLAEQEDGVAASS